MNVRYLTAEDIEKSLINLSQLVFEVTDDCNLSCVYCAFGELYCDYDRREKKYLRLPDVKRLIDYLSELWQNSVTEASVPETYIGFYGGEPLLNMPFIREVIDYLDSLHLNRQFKYSITTNAVLLDRYMSYLVEKNFSMLISLDGDEYANSYRVNKAGDNPFQAVLKNIHKLKENYPEFYKWQVKFNAVLHDRNDVETIMRFFKEELSKTPTLSELSITGLNPSKKGVFDKMFNNMSKSFQKSEHYDQLSEEAFIQCPDVYEAMRYIEIESGNVFETVKQLLPNPGRGFVPTGTCIPFEKKLFVTVNGKILPCERIGHQFGLGQVSETQVELDPAGIARKYNEYYQKMENQCSHCKNRPSCIQCLFNLKDVDKKPVCYGFMNDTMMEQFKQQQFQFMREHPGVYREIMEKVLTL